MTDEQIIEAARRYLRHRRKPLRIVYVPITDRVSVDQHDTAEVDFAAAEPQVRRFNRRRPRHS